jgi:hypothetical protein
MGRPWWMWVAGGVVAVGVLLTRAAARHRQSVLDGFVGYVRRLGPDVEIVRADRGALGRGPWLAVKLPSGAEATVSLVKLILTLGEAPYLSTAAFDERRDLGRGLAAG